MQSQARRESSLMEIYAREGWGRGEEGRGSQAPLLESRAADKLPLTDTHTDGLKVRARPNQREPGE